MKNISLLNRKKQDPGKYFFTGKARNTDFGMQLFTYSKDNCTEDKNINFEAMPKFANESNNFWLNLHGLDNTEMVVNICKKQDIHSLVIQDILDVNQRPKFQEFDNFSFLTLKSIVPSDSEIITEQISFVFAKNFLISFQERKADFFEHVRFRLRDSVGLVRERSTDFLLYVMLESILDNYFKTLNKLDEEIETYNFSDINKDPSPAVLATIESHKKFVHFIKKSILPIKEFSQIVERGESVNIEKRHIKYFLEIKDLCLTLIDSCDMILSSLESSTNLFFSVQGHRMNQVMKTLTIVSTIFIPLTFVAGIYGMNFLYMPELSCRYGYLGVWLLIIAIFASLIHYFKRKKWF